MDPNRSIKLRWLHGMLHDVTSELARLQFSRIGAHTWQPAINAYRCDKCIRVCVDLAGVERSRIDLTVEPEPSLFALRAMSPSRHMRRVAPYSCGPWKLIMARSSARSICLR